MNTLYLDSQKFIFWAVAIVVIAAAVFLLVFIPVRKYRKKVKWQDDYYLKIESIVKNYDYYLLNGFAFRDRTGKLQTIDHIVLAEKFIYLICVSYYEGDLTGNFTDPSLVFVRDGKREYTPNPVLSIREKLTEFAGATGLSPKLMIGVIVVNDGCKVGIRNDSKQLYIIQIGKLGRLVRAIESRKVKKLDPEEEEKAVRVIDKMNRRKKKQNETKPAD